MRDLLPRWVTPFRTKHPRRNVSVCSPYHTSLSSPHCVYSLQHPSVNSLHNTHYFAPVPSHGNRSLQIVEKQHAPEVTSCGFPLTSWCQLISAQLALPPTLFFFCLLTVVRHEKPWFLQEIVRNGGYRADARDDRSVHGRKSRCQGFYCHFRSFFSLQIERKSLNSRKSGNRRCFNCQAECGGASARQEGENLGALVQWKTALFNSWPLQLRDLVISDEQDIGKFHAVVSVSHP